MSTKRKSFNNAFKAKVAVEALKGQKTVAEIASEFEIHTTQVNTWKKHLLDGAADSYILTYCLISGVHYTPHFMLKCDNKSGGIYMKNNDNFLKYLPMRKN